VDLDELDLVCIDPLPSYVWYQDMADFAERISDERVGRRLARPSTAEERSAGSRLNCRERRMVRFHCHRPNDPGATSIRRAAPRIRSCRASR
jgi:hypothetical protein